MRIKVETVYSQWSGEGSGTIGGVVVEDPMLAGGVTAIDDPDEKLLRCLAGALAAGVLRTVTVDGDGKDATAAQNVMSAAVQSQDDGEAAYAEAQKTGRWHHGNLTDFVAQRRARLAEAEDDDTRARLEGDIADAEARLAEIAVPE